MVCGTSVGTLVGEWGYVLIFAAGMPIGRVRSSYRNRRMSCISGVAGAVVGLLDALPDRAGALKGLC